MAGRPPLDIGAHGKIKRIDAGGGVWLARCRFRGADGRTKIMERRTPKGVPDRYGAQAEKALLEALDQIRGDGGGTVTGSTRVSALTALWLEELRKRSHSVRTTDTYTAIVAKLDKKAGGLLVREATARRIDLLLTDLAETHGATTARQARTVLSGVFLMAVREGAVDRNPVKDVGPVRVVKRNGQDTKSASSTNGIDDAKRALTTAELHTLVSTLGTSAVALPAYSGAKKRDTTTPKGARPGPKVRTVGEWARDIDLLDPITMLAGTGLRRSELLGLRWVDYDEDQRTISVTGRVVRGRETGLIREDTTKSRTSRRTVALPGFVVDMLDRRSGELHPSVDGVIFPSSVGTLRDPDNLSGQWNRVRDALGFGWVTTHTFRRTVATLVDDAGLSARIGADHLGHAKVSMTQDVYMGRGKVHVQVAALLDQAISDE